MRDCIIYTVHSTNSPEILHVDGMNTRENSSDNISSMNNGSEAIDQALVSDNVSIEVLNDESTVLIKACLLKQTLIIMIF